MSVYFDHLVLNVKDLDGAINEFREAGFTVTEGGIHKGGLSKNAIIFFEDDTFIELFTMTDSIKSRIVRLLKNFKFFKRFQYSKKWGLAYRFYSRALELPEGIIDIGFLSDDYDTEWSRINTEGIFLTKSMNASRKKPDGSKASWQMASPFINELPFLRSPYRPVNELSPEVTEHVNKVTGISNVKVIALDYKDMVSKYQTFLGVSATTGDKNGQMAKFQLKGVSVEIIKSSEHKEIRDQLRGKGMGMYGVVFKKDSTEKPEMISDKLRGLAVMED